MFELGDVDDLLAPRSPSTGRALDSFVRRATFEALKHAVATVDSAPASARFPLHALRDSFATRLPGDPHAIADAIANPAIGALLREGLARDAGGDGAHWFALGVARLRAAIGDAPAIELAERLPVEGRVAFHVGDGELEACVGVVTERPTEGDVRCLREALTIVRSAAPPVRADVDRFASTILCTRTPPHELPSTAIGVACVPGGASVQDAIVAIVGSTTCGKLAALEDAIASRSDAALRARRDGSRLAAAVVLRYSVARGWLRLSDVEASRLELPGAPEPDRRLPDAFASVLAEWRSLVAD